MRAVFGFAVVARLVHGRLGSPMIMRACRGVVESVGVIVPLRSCSICGCA